MYPRVKFSKNIKLNNPYVIAAWPGMGQVAYITAQYLIKKLGAQEFASMEAKEYFYPTGIDIHNGMMEMTSLPSNKFYYWQDKSKNIELIIFLAQAQPDLSLSVEYSQLILDTCRRVSRDIKCVFTFAAMPTTIEHTQNPQVFSAVSSRVFLSRLKNLKIEALNRSQVSGMNGLFLGLAKKQHIDGICLLAQIPLYTVQIDNPWAASAILKKLSRLINIKIDLGRLHKEAQEIEAQISKFVDYFKESLQVGEPAEQPINQDDIERIKHALNQYSKLPVSAKSRIEKLFEDAKSDLSKAKELKVELDKWNIYSEYEDRFLDLFRNNRDKDN